MFILLLLLACARADDRDAFLSWVAQPVPSSDATSTPASIQAPFPLERAPDDATELAPPGYRFAQTAYTEIAAQVRAQPHPIAVEQIGVSVQGRPLWAFHIGDPQSPRRVLVFAGIHAMEWISTEVALELLLALAAAPTPHPARVTIIPLLNPDGRARVERDLRLGEERYRRGNARNVDLNRDFSVNRQARAVWRKAIPGYYGASPAPLSQPESRALDALADRERYHRAASLHSFGGFF